MKSNLFLARFAKFSEIKNWDKCLLQNNPNGGNALQSLSLSKIKSKYGWKSRFIVYESKSYNSYNLILEKSFPFLGKLWYMIKGPDIFCTKDLFGILKASKRLIKKYNLPVFLLKIEPEILKMNIKKIELDSLGLIKSDSIQPNDNTAILNVNYNNSALLLKSLYKRSRYAINKSLKQGTKVSKAKGNEKDYQHLYNLMLSVQKRQKIKLRPYSYYRLFWSTFILAGYGNIYFIYKDSVPCIGIFVIHYGKKAIYKDGGSTTHRLQHGDAHLIHWKAINDMRDSNCSNSINESIVEYDLCGTPPKSELKNKKHKFYGLGIFKSSFTKNIVEYIGVYDYPIKYYSYFLWYFFLKKIIYKFYYFILKKYFY